MTNLTRKRILLTGATGGIGSAFFRATRADYTFRLADRRSPTLVHDLDGEHEALTIELADPAACQEACRDIDIVIHLAGDPRPFADFYRSLLPNNILSTYNIFRAAKDQGCQRVIYASSVHAVMGYPLDVQVHPDSPTRPTNMYGVSKCFGEAVAHYFAYAEQLSSIAIRIGAYDVNSDDANWLRSDPNIYNLGCYVSEGDMNQLLRRCVEIPDIEFAIVHGISDGRFKRFDIDSTRTQLGYAPQDDPFELFADNLPAWLSADKPEWLIPPENRPSRLTPETAADSTSD